MSLTLNLNSDGLLSVPLKDKDGAVVDAATVTGELVTRAKAAVKTDGGDDFEAFSMTEGDTAGTYEADIRDDLALVDGQQLILKVTGVKSGKQAYAEYGVTVAVDSD